MAIDTELIVKLIAEAKDLTGFDNATNAGKKLESTLTNLETANKRLISASEALEKARESGDEKAIKAAERLAEVELNRAVKAEQAVQKAIISAEKEIAEKEKLAQKAQEKADRENETNEKATQKAISLAEKQEQAKQKAEEKAQAQAEKEKARQDQIAQKAEQQAAREIAAQQKIVQKAEEKAEKEKAAAAKILEANQQQLGILNQLEAKLKELKVERDKSNDVSAIKEFNSKIEETQNKIKDLKDVGEKSSEKINEGTKESSLNFGELAKVAGSTVLVLEGIGKAAGFLKDLASGAFEAVKAIAAQDLALANLSRTSGASKEAIAAIQNELVKFGESAESVKGGIAQFGGFIADALANPLSDAGKNAKLLGIDLAGLKTSLNPFDDALKQVSATTKGSTNSFEQFKAATLAFGEDDAPKVISALKDLDDKIGKVKQRGQILTPEQSKQAQELTASLGDVNQEVEGLTKQILAELLPSVNRILDDAKKAIESLDQDSIEGLKAGIKEIGRTLEAIAPLIINVSQFLVEFAGNFSTAISAVLHPFETLNFLITGNSTASEKAAISQDKLNKGFIASKFGAEQLTKQIQELNQVQNFTSGLAEINAQRALIAVQTRLKQGLIDEAQAAKESAKIEEDLARQKEDKEFQKLAAVKTNVNNELKARNDAASKLQSDLDRNTEAIKKAQEDRDKFRIEGANKLKKLQGEFESANITKEQLEKEKELYSQSLIDKTNNIQALQQKNKEYNTSLEVARKSAADFNRAINTTEVLDVKTAKQDELDARKAVEDQTLAFQQSRLQTTLAVNKKIAESENSIFADNDKNLSEVQKNFAIATQSNAEELSKRVINEQQYQQQVLNLQVANNKDRLAVLQQTQEQISAFKAQGGIVDAEKEKKLAEDIAKTKEAIILGERDAEIKAAQDVLENKKQDFQAEATLAQGLFASRQSFISQIRESTKQQQEQSKLDIDIARQTALEASKKVDLEVATLEVLRKENATKEQLKQKEADIVKALGDAARARAEASDKEKAERKKKEDDQKKALALSDQENAKIVDLGARVNSVVGEFDKLNGTIQSSSTSFDAVNASVDKVKQKIEDLRHDAEQLLLFSGAVVEGRIEAALGYYDTAFELERKLNERIIEESRQASLKAAADRTAILQDAANKQVEIEKNAQDQIKNAKQQERKDLKKNKEDEAKELEAFNQKELESQEKLADDKQKINENFAKKEKEIADKAVEEEKARQEQLIQIKEDAALDEADRLNKIQRDNLAERAKLEEQINAEKDPKKKAELQAQLGEITKKGAQAETNEKAKQAELDKALAESATDEEFQVRKKAIEAKYNLLQDEQSQREQIIKGGNQKELEEFDRLVAEQKKRDEDRLQKELDRIKAQQQKKKDQAAQDRADREKERDDQLSDLQKSFDKEETARQKAHDEAVKNLKTRQQEIKDQYKDTVNKVLQDEISALSEVAKAVGLTGVEFSKSFSDNLAKVAALNDELKKVVGNLANIGNAGNTSNTNNNNNNSSQSSLNGQTGNNTTVLNSGFGAKERGSATNTNSGKTNSSINSNTASSTSTNTSTTNNVNPNQKSPSGKPNTSLDNSTTPSGANPSSASGDGGKNPGQGGNPDDQGSIPLKPKSVAEYEKICERIYKKFNGDPVTDHYSVRLFSVVQNLMLANGLSLGNPNPKLGFIDTSLVFNLTENGQTPAVKKSKKSDFDKATKELINIVQDALNKKGKDDKKEDDKPPAKTTPGGDGSSASIGGKKATSDTVDSGTITRTSSTNAPDTSGLFKDKKNQNVPKFDRSSEETSFEGEGNSKRGAAQSFANGGNNALTPEQALAIANGQAPNGNTQPAQVSAPIGNVIGTLNVSVDGKTFAQAIVDEVQKQLGNPDTINSIDGKISSKTRQDNFDRNPKNNVRI